MFQREILGGAALVLSLGCSTDTAGLARRDPAAAGAAGEGGVAGAVQGSAGVGGENAGGSAGTAQQAGEAGVGALTIVHGLVDGGRLSSCLWDPQTETYLDATAASINYAEGLRLETTWNVSEQGMELQLFVVPSDAGAPRSCSDLAEQAADPDLSTPAARDAGASDAGAPPGAPFPEPLVGPRRVGEVSLPPGALSPGGHYVLVAAGCTSSGPSVEPDVCGDPDAVFGSRRSLVLAVIAGPRVGGTDTIGLQFVNASRAVPRADLLLQSDGQRPSTPLGGDVPFGSVRPTTASPVTPPIGVELHVERETLPSYAEAWADTIAGSALMGISSGGNYLLVYVGPRPPASAAGISPPRFVLVQGP